MLAVTVIGSLASVAVPVVLGLVKVARASVPFVWPTPLPVSSVVIVVAVVIVVTAASLLVAAPVSVTVVSVSFFRTLELALCL